jgi:hypothetical protein
MLPLFAPGSRRSGQYDLSEAAYASKNKEVSAQAPDTPWGIELAPDGLTAYVLEQAGAKVFQYTLSVPWDISTAIYTSKTFSAGSQDGNMTVVRFSADGTKMYVGGNGNDTLYQYTLSTAWDVSTASYASKSLSLATQDNVIFGFFFKTDGSAVYAHGQQNDSVYQYTLGTPWDLSTGSYASKLKDISAQTTGGTDVVFSTDGSRMFVASSSVVYQYTLGTAWDVSTASYSSVSFNAGTQDATMRGICFGDNGAYMYLMGGVAEKIFQYDL